jgi:hypothetical protein
MRETRTNKSNSSRPAYEWLRSGFFFKKNGNSDRQRRTGGGQKRRYEPQLPETHKTDAHWYFSSVAHFEHYSKVLQPEISFLPLSYLSVP